MENRKFQLSIGGTFIFWIQMTPPHRIYSVSYTHLDVYKRQPASSMMTSRTNMINPETNAVFIIETPFPQIILSLPGAPAHIRCTDPQY